MERHQANLVVGPHTENGEYHSEPIDGADRIFEDSNGDQDYCNSLESIEHRISQRWDHADHFKRQEVLPEVAKSIEKKKKTSNTSRQFTQLK